VGTSPICVQNGRRPYRHLVPLEPSDADVQNERRLKMLRTLREATPAVGSDGVSTKPWPRPNLDRLVRVDVQTHCDGCDAWAKWVNGHGHCYCEKCAPAEPVAVGVGD
jgi:hypothetical protein